MTNKSGVAVYNDYLHDKIGITSEKITLKEFMTAVAPKRHRAQRAPDDIAEISIAFQESNSAAFGRRENSGINAGNARRGVDSRTSSVRVVESHSVKHSHADA